MNKQTVKIASIILLSMNLAFVQAQKASEYKIVWEENFDKSTVDKNIWNLENNKKGGGNAEFQYYKPENINIEVHPEGYSCLVLCAKKENYKGRPATSGRLNTAGNLSVKYGMIEARVCIPKTANGLWPAFWLMGDDKDQVNWPKCGEIDVIEMGHKNGIDANATERYYNGATHWGESFNNGKYPNLAQASKSDYSIQEGFHTFTLVWTPDSLNMFLDKDKFPTRKPYFAMSIKGEDAPGNPGRYFHKPYHLIANLAVGGFFTGLPSPSKKAICVSSKNKNFQKITALPQDGSAVKYYIDYIRIYQNGTPGEELNIKK